MSDNIDHAGQLDPWPCGEPMDLETILARDQWVRDNRDMMDNSSIGFQQALFDATDDEQLDRDNAIDQHLPERLVMPDACDLAAQQLLFDRSQPFLDQSYDDDQEAEALAAIDPNCTVAHDASVQDR